MRFVENSVDESWLELYRERHLGHLPLSATPEVAHASIDDASWHAAVSWVSPPELCCGSVTRRALLCKCASCGALTTGCKYGV